jgi:hypothetical protein
MEANSKMVGELLGELFPGCDIAAGLGRVQTVVEAFADRIQPASNESPCRSARWPTGLRRRPPALGYEPMLIERGHPPLLARGLSYWLVRSGKDEAPRVTTHRTVADTLRFLAKPGRTRGSISRKAAALLEVWNATSALGDAFDASEISVFEFVEALEGAVRGELAACRRVAEVAAAVAPGTVYSSRSKSERGEYHASVSP